MSPKTLRIIGIAGSLRKNSFSEAVLTAFADLLPEGTEFSRLDIGNLPHYNQDLDIAGPPAAVAEARAAISACDAVMMVTPEYNHGIPGVLKNALDWLSRPVFKSCFAGKPVLFATQSEGALGGVRAQYQIRETLAAMQCRLVPMQEIVVPYVQKGVADGVFSDERVLTFTRERLLRLLNDIPH